MKKKTKITFYALGILSFVSATKYMLNKNKKVKHIKKELPKNNIQEIKENIETIEDKNKVFSKRKYILLKEVYMKDSE